MCLICERIDQQIEYTTDCLRRALPDYEPYYQQARVLYEQARRATEEAEKLMIHANNAMARYMSETGGPAEPFGG